jgi:peptidoglycan/xylan/chitin deacetylase (PgdA/CDA1 family)
LFRDTALLSEARVIGAAVGKRLRFFDAYGFLKRKHIGSQVVIVFYHRVSPARCDWSASTISPQGFESQIRFLCENFEVLSLDQLWQDLQKNRALPKKAVVVSFDDGYRDNYVYAVPILGKYAVPATFFLTTGHVGFNKPFPWDKVGYLVHHAAAARLKLEELGTYSLKSAFGRRYAISAIWEKLKHFPEQKRDELIEKLAVICRVAIPADLGSRLNLSWEEAMEMSRDGFEFGAHSVTHPILTDLPPEQAKWEICRSKEDLEKRLRKKVKFFSYPDGSFNRDIVEIVKQTGVVGAVGTNPSWITRRSDVYRLGRINMIEDNNRSAALLCGFWGDLGTLLRIVRNDDDQDSRQFLA